MAVAAEAIGEPEPSLERARDLARDANVIPVVHRLLDDTETPVSAFLKLRDGSPCFLLESAEQGRVGRYSFLGFRPREILRWEGGTAEDPYEAARELVGRHTLADVDGLPPFPGGAVGVFGYDLVRTVEPLGEPNPDPLGIPDMALMVCELMLAFDHLRRELMIIGYAFCDAPEDVDAAHARAVGLIAEAREALGRPVPATEPASDPELRSRAASGAAELFESNQTRQEFEANVSRIIEYVRAGDAFQVVPSQRFTAPAPVEAFSVYRGLRAVNPSPYMYFVDLGDFQLAGASPEPLLRVNDRRVEMRPIAGTYPRGRSEEEDRALAAALLADPKERAEHVMLVDLSRNDLGRVCEYGSVAVDELMVVETYSHVLHIVSQVSGTLRADVDAVDALRAVLPAGTLSGAPKVRAMQIIDELEPHKRCSYGGAVGYLSFDGNLDTAIHIRTVVIKDGEVHVQCGGGTVADAVPSREFEESLDKAQATFTAIELAASQPGWA